MERTPMRNHEGTGPHMQYGARLITCCGIPAGEGPAVTSNPARVRCRACLEVIAREHLGEWRDRTHIEYGAMRTACGLDGMLGAPLTLDVTKLTCEECREFCRKHHTDGHRIPAAA